MQRWEDEEFEPLPMPSTGLGSRRKPFVELESTESEAEGILDEFGQRLVLSASEGEGEEEYVAPEHACRYCDLADAECVAKCNGCNKWFCNEQSSLSSGSHIVQHLVRSRHKEISLHPDSAVGDAVLECYNCGCRNIFLLGYVAAKADTVVVLLCRTPCAASGAGKESGWEVEQWQPLISNRALLGWLVKTAAGEAAGLRARRVTTVQINRLEDVWRSRPEATLGDMDTRQAEAAELVPVQTRYEDAFAYQAVMAPLVSVEAECDKSIKEGQLLEGVSVRWDTGLNQSRLAFFALPRAADELRITLGDEVTLRHAGRHFAVTGVVIRNPLRMIATEELCVEVRRPGHAKIPEDLSSGYSVVFLWKGTSYDRMQAALKTLALDSTCVDRIVLQKLLGHDIEQPELAVPVPAVVSAPNLPALNHSQAHAVRSVLTRPLSLIQGPPGTGKTVTSATIVYHLAMLGQGPILVTAPSNVAVDHLTEKIHMTGLRVVRIAARWREDVDTAVSFLSLHEQVRNNDSRPELQKLLQLRDERGELAAKDEERLHRLIRASEQDILRVRAAHGA